MRLIVSSYEAGVDLLDEAESPELGTLGGVAKGEIKEADGKAKVMKKK